jgi:uncharacterized coiled-coil protein SlyX
MSSTGRVDEGVVTQDDNTIEDGNDSLDASYMTDTDPADLRAQTIEVMRRAGAILEANGLGTREERAANRRRQFEEELNGDLTDKEVEGGPRREGMNAEESLPPAVAEASRGEGVEVEGGGGEEDLLTGGGVMPFDPALNQFLSAAPVKPDVVKNGDWPKSVAPRVKMSAQDKDCIIRANANIAKAVEMGKRINEKACQDHASFTQIIKSGATALNGARRDKAKAEAGLKKSKATAAVAPDCAILMIERAHANEKVEELTKTKASNEKKIDKLEKKIEELEKKLEKVKSTSVSTGDAALEAHRKKKEIDLKAHEMKLNVEDQRQERKEARKTGRNLSYGTRLGTHSPARIGKAWLKKRDIVDLDTVVALRR